MKYLTIILLAFSYGFYFKPSPAAVTVFAVVIGVGYSAYGIGYCRRTA